MPGKIYTLAIVALSAGMATLGVEAAARHTDPSARATIKDTKGATVGELRIDEDNGHPKLTIDALALPPGFHGFHIHTKGVCDPRSKDPATGSPFFSAGPHFDRRPSKHPNHSGDLPDLLIGSDGKGRAMVETDRFKVAQLLDRDGSAIVIHALPDNMANIPHRFSHEGGGTGPDAESLKTGDSGARIACGVITRRGAS
jgi:superoxide dismutase, Cu-Zn family